MNTKKRFSEETALFEKKLIEAFSLKVIEDLYKIFQDHEEVKSFTLGCFEQTQENLLRTEVRRAFFIGVSCVDPKAMNQTLVDLMVQVLNLNDELFDVIKIRCSWRSSE